jgi:hypothetical protein
MGRERSRECKRIWRLIFTVNRRFEDRMRGELELWLLQTRD